MLGTNKIILLTIEKKRTKGVVHEEWTKGMKKNQTCPSLPVTEP